MSRKKYKRKRKISVFKVMGVSVFLTLLLALGISTLISSSTHKELQKKLDAINQEAEEIEADNVELRRILEDDDMDAYMEKVAIERMNYAYPDERRYYDKSRN